MPHLLHTANSSQIEIELENIEMDKAFNSSRFAVEVLLISPRGSNYSLDATSKRSLDDEYAPGVFEVSWSWMYKIVVKYHNSCWITFL